MPLCNMAINAYRSGGFNKSDFIFSVTHGSENKKKGLHLTFSYELCFQKIFQLSINPSITVAVLYIRTMRHKGTHFRFHRSASQPLLLFSIIWGTYKRFFLVSSLGHLNQNLWGETQTSGNYFFPIPSAKLLKKKKKKSS